MRIPILAFSLTDVLNQTSHFTTNPTCPLPVTILPVYNTATLHLNCVFSIFVNQSECRLMCATRSGTIVSLTTPRTHLLRLFFGVSPILTLTPGESTTLSTESQMRPLRARRRVKRCRFNNETTRSLSSMKSLAKHHPILSPTHSQNLTVIPPGAAAAVSDPQRKKVVLLKDDWRVDGYDPEGRTYRLLNSKSVRNIPQLVTTGDVLGVPGWISGDEPFLKLHKHRVHVHYRLVLDTVGHSLTHFSSTWELVTAIYDAMIGELFR